MKKFFLVSLLVIATTLLVSCTNRNVVTIYSSMEDFRNEDLSKQLKGKFPEIKVNIEYYSTGNHAAKLRNEGLKTKADLFLGLETAYVVSMLDNFEVLEDYDFSIFSDEVITENEKRYIPWDRYSGSIIINTKVLSDLGLEEPKSYEDLLKPQYKDLIMMPNPKTSGTGYQFLLQWVNNMGEINALKFVDKLSENILQFTTSGTGPINSLVRGDIAIGLGMTFQGVYELNQGVPLKLLFDESGAPFNTSSAGVIKGRLANDRVKTIYEYIFNEYLIRDKDMFMPENLFETPRSNPIPNYPELNYDPMDNLYDINFKLELLEKWQY